MAARKTTTKERTSSRDSAKPNVVPLAARQTQSWTIESIRSAIGAQITGRFGPTCSLAASMLQDESFSTAINRRINALIRSDLTVEAYDPTEPGAGQAVDLCSRYLPQMLDEGEFRTCLLDWHCSGVFLARISVKAIDGMLLPCLQHLNPCNLRFDQHANEGMGEWMFLAADCNEHVVTPGDGSWVLITSWHPGYNAGFVSSLAETWANGTMGMRSWFDWCDNSGFPLTKAKVPADAKPEDVAAFIDGLAEIQTRKVVATPQDKDGYGYDVDVIASSAAEGYAGLKQLVEHKRLMMQISILGGNLSSEVGANGSYAATESHMGVQREMVASDARLIGSGLREQLLRVAVQWNLGAYVEPPLMCWDVTPPTDPLTDVQALNGLATFIKAMGETGYSVDNLIDIGERLGVQLSRKT